MKKFHIGDPVWIKTGSNLTRKGVIMNVAPEGSRPYTVRCGKDDFYCSDLQMESREAKIIKKDTEPAIDEETKEQAERLTKERMEKLMGKPKFDEIKMAFYSIVKVLEQAEAQFAEPVVALAEEAIKAKIKDGVR